MMTTLRHWLAGILERWARALRGGGTGEEQQRGGGTGEE